MTKPCKHQFGLDLICKHCKIKMQSIAEYCREPKELEEQKGDLSDKLLPCPFCDSVADYITMTFVNDNKQHWVVCKCNIRTAQYNTKDDAIKAWNTRAPSKQLTTTATQQALDTAVEALKEVLSRNAELQEVATLRGDNDLPHPANDSILWTARMSDAWDGLKESIGIIEAALAIIKG